MKKLVTALIVAALPSSALAADLADNYVFIEDSVEPLAPSVVSHLELSAGWWHKDQELESDQDWALLGGAGRVNIPFAGNWNLELEAGGTYAFVDQPNQRDRYIVGGYAHLWAGLGDVRLGAFGGGDYFQSAISDVTFWIAGAEAEVDVGNNLTLGVQGSYGDADCGSCEFVYVIGWADFYPTPNTKIGVQGGWMDSVNISDPTFDTWSVWGIVEQRFAGMPLSLFVRGGYEANIDQSIQSVEFYSVMGGLRVFFDQNALSLQEHDHQVPFEYRLPQFTTLYGS